MAKIYSMLVIMVLLFTVTQPTLADDLVDVVEDSQSLEFHTDSDFHWLEHKKDARRFDMGSISYTLGDSFIKLGDVNFSNEIFYTAGVKRIWNFDGTLELREAEDSIMVGITFKF